MIIFDGETKKSLRRTSTAVDDLCYKKGYYYMDTLTVKNPLKDEKTGEVLGFDPTLRGGRLSVEDDRWPGSVVITPTNDDPYVLID